MGVHINQDDDGYMGLRGTDQDDGAFIFASAEYDPNSVDKAFFVAPRAVRVVGITLRVTVAGTNGSAVTVMVEKVPSGTAIGSGTDLMTGTLNLKGTANTNQTGTLSTTAGALSLAKGNALALDFTGTLTDATGVVTVAMCPL
jgi:hypothetical protein